MSDWDNLVEPARAALETLIRTGDAAADRIEELEAKLDQAVKDSEKYKHAFAAQSRKLQAVLHIEGVKATLAELKGQDDE